MLECGADGELTRAGESDAEEHELTPRVSLISRSAALDTNHLKARARRNLSTEISTLLSTRVNKVVPIVGTDTRLAKS